MAEPITTPEPSDPAVELPASGEEQAAAPPRRPLSTTRLLLTALLVGPLLGGAVGYAVQAGSPPTPLPALAVPSPAYPATPADPQAVAEAAVAPLKIDGDLRTLLVSRPEGTEEWNDGRTSGSGWYTVGEQAASVRNSAMFFHTLLQDGFRRDATVTWRNGGVKWRVELIQYHSDQAASARREVERSSVSGLPLGNVPGGSYYIAQAPQTYADSTELFYLGQAVARRGDVVMQITVHAPSRVDHAELTKVAEQQWERLV